jgi:predicted GH43/DUF377 family glycosyl hydrolase
MGLNKFTKYTISSFTSMILIFFLFHSDALALSVQKNSNNPVLTPTNPSWEQNHNFSPTVIKDGSMYKMWYSAHDGARYQIGYATSTDGINWIKNPNAVISPRNNGWETDVLGPYVLKDENEYKMWFRSTNGTIPNDNYHKGQERYRISYATSLNGIDWNVYPNYVLYAISGSWNSEGVAAPSVIKDGNTYKMWFSGRNSSGVWSIGYATSSNGIDWNQHVNNPIFVNNLSWEGSHVSSADIIQRNNELLMLYHAGPVVPKAIGYATSGDGVNWVKNSQAILELGGAGEFDSVYIGTPSVIINNNKLWMYYSGYDGGEWSIGLATEQEAPGAGKDAIVIVPGMFASYDPYAFSTCSSTPWQNWKLTPNVTEYNGLIKTLETAGYVRDENLFIFPYDWRKRISESGADLKSFINSQVVPKNPGKKIDLIGHSLGGLVARSYLQEYDSGLIDQLITVGTPHHGVLEAYKPWAGGELPIENSWRIATSLMVNICKIKTASLTNKSVIEKTAPVFADLLPTETYLKRAGTHLNIEYSTLDASLQNPYLINLNNSFSGLLGQFDALTSTSFETAKFYGVATYLEDRLLGIYTQGRPTAVLVNGPGDKTILSDSATFPSDSYFDLPLDHRGLIYSTSAIEKITQILNLSPTSITQGQLTSYSPSLLMLLRSPAEITVKNPGGEAVASGKRFVFLPGYSSGEYETTVTGTDSGKYELVVGQVTENSQNWESYKNETNLGEIDIYKFKADTNNPKPGSIIDEKAQNPLLSAKIKIEDLKSKDNSPLLERALEYINKVKQLQEQGNNILASEYIIRTIRYLIRYSGTTVNFEYKNTALNAVNNLQTAYSTIALNAGLSTNQIDKKLAIARLSLSLAEQLLKRRDFVGQAASVSAASFAKGKEKLNGAQELKSSDPYFSQILSQTARFLFKEL